MSVDKVEGGDIVRLINGKTVEVADIKNNHIVIASDEWYPSEDIVEIVKKFKEKL